MRKVQPIRELKAIRAIKGNLRKKNPRNFLLFTLGINTGLRISDILKLKVEDVKDQAGEIKEYLDLKEKKTKKQRLIYINDEAKNALEYFFDKTGIYNLERYLFISDKTKINKPIIELIQEVLGHQSISMTKRYLGITDDEVTKVLKNFNL